MTNTSTSSRKEQFFNIPVIGYLGRTAWFIATLPKIIDRRDRQRAEVYRELNDTVVSLQVMQDKLNDRLQEIQSASIRAEQQVADMKHKLVSVHQSQQASPSSAPASSLLADDHDLDQFYIDFENKFRGTEDEIKDRLKVYLPYFHKLKADFKKTPVLDIGCGRGELLDLLKSDGIRAIGLDLNENMVARCNELGYEAVQADALEYLRKQPSNSLAAITGFHIVEHIPFNFLLRLFEECNRVLIPGGVIIFETPNPENLHVGSFSFYYDPSHLHPLAPEVLAFAVKSSGFHPVEILRLHPKGDGHENDNRDDEYVAEVLRRFYGPQDYAVIGYKRNNEKPTRTRKRKRK